MIMNTFEVIKKSLLKRKVVFEEITFTDIVQAARTNDTSIDHNYHPENGVKTLIIKTKTDLQAVILQGSDSIDQTKLKVLVGKWSVANSDALANQLGFLPGEVCPLVINIPILIDKKVLELTTWSIGAGDNQKGLNVTTDEALKHISSYTIVEVRKTGENNTEHMNSNNSELLTRRVDHILPSKEGLEKLIAGKKIRLYQGFDPTGGRLHLGHAIGMKKLMEFANAGHEVIFLFGTGTVLVGDPSLRDTGRKLITQAEIDENIKGWKKQVSPIVDFDKVTIKQNGDWLTKLTLKEIIGIASNISATQLFKRESFTRRIERGDAVWYHETMYPLLQGYDSVAMDVDLEIGGTDQEFNMLVGRELQKKMNNREKFVLTTPMIVGTDGKQMSKSSGNCIFLNDTPEDMYSKLMMVKDELVATYFELLTDLPMTEIAALDPNQPVENKKRLAFDITRQFHDEDGAKKGQAYFESFVQTKTAPSDTPMVKVSGENTTLIELLKSADLGVSNSDIKRTIEQSGVEIAGKKITNPTELLTLEGGEIIKFGKHTYRKVQL